MSRRGLRSTARRRRQVLVELVLAAAICLAGYGFAAGWLQILEARWVVASLRIFGRDDVSDALPGHILIFGDAGAVLNAEVTASCSSILSIVGLTALTVTVFRGRRQHALAGLVVAVVALLALNWVRLTASTLAGIAWGRPAMVLFHDWVGSLWNFAATFLGFLVLVAVTLPTGERAEQDAAGRHTARRPSSWARPGLGYQSAQAEVTVRRGGRRLASLIHRYVLPRRLSAHLAARREAARIDYRIGHLPPAERTARVRQLAGDGLGAHTASLLAVATYERDVAVLDVLAAEVAARQWEPVTTSRLLSLRLWARGWAMARGAAAPARPVPGSAGRAAPPGDDDTDVILGRGSALRPPVPTPRSVPPAPEIAAGSVPVRSSRQRPRSFAVRSSAPGDPITGPTSGPTTPPSDPPTAEDLR